MNLLYGAFYHRQPGEIDRIAPGESRAGSAFEVDMIKFSGPAFPGVDNRLMSLQLVSQGLTNAVMFTADGETVQPADILHKKAILVERGSFRPVTYATNDMLDGARTRFSQTMRVLGRGTCRADGNDPGESAFGRPAESRRFSRPGGYPGRARPHRHGLEVRRVYRLAWYLARYTNRMIGLVMGVPSLMEIFDEKYYLNLEGGILEALGRMFKSGLKLYVYPMIDDKTGQIRHGDASWK